MTHCFRARVRACGSAIVGVSLAACAQANVLASLGTYYDVRVSSFASPAQPSNPTFVVLPANPGVTPEDLQFREFAPMVTRALVAQGFRLANAEHPPQIGVFIAYGVGTPRVSYSSGLQYVPGSTASVTTTTTIPGALPINSTGSVSTSGSFQSVATASTEYPRFAVLSAVDVDVLLNQKKIVQVWRTEIFSEGSSSDIRTVLPYLLAAAEPYFGRSSGKQIRKRVSALNSEARALTVP